MSAFDEMHPQDQREWLDTVKGYAKGVDGREREADLRNEEITTRLDLLMAALAAGARAFADTIERGPRRR